MRYIKTMLNEKAFTLSEVLITLGIIGTVAAITMPSLINNYQKQSTAAKVKKFYNTINNAVNLSAAENGDVNTWFPEKKDNTYEENAKFVRTYILPYLKYTKAEKCSETSILFCVYLIDGGLMTWRTDKNGTDIVYYVNGKSEKNTHNYFPFQFNKATNISPKTFVEPYTFRWNGEYETLKTNEDLGCRKDCTNPAYCTKMLQLNNWQFPKNYPW